MSADREGNQPDRAGVSREDLLDKVESYRFYTDEGLDPLGCRPRPKWLNSNSPCPLSDLKSDITTWLELFCGEVSLEDFPSRLALVVTDRRYETILAEFAELCALLTDRRLAQSIEALAERFRQLKPRLDRAAGQGNTVFGTRLKEQTRFSYEYKDSVDRLEKVIFCALRKHVNASDACLLKHTVELCAHFGVSRPDEMDPVGRVRKRFHRAKAAYVPVDLDELARQLRLLTEMRPEE